jgi:hypothetical protein
MRLEDQSILLKAVAGLDGRSGETTTAVILRFVHDDGAGCVDWFGSAIGHTLIQIALAGGPPAGAATRDGGRD